ncbi:MAG: hypothetical protein JST00_42190 [Deltaproteobacteria bacterium]|nr:hypothetical protein [Deltaproteobacteria bacterium]
MMPRSVAAAGALLFTVMFAACAEVPPPRSPPPTELYTGRARTTCPLGIQNAHVTFDETATGAALVFTTTPENVDALRVRARDASAMHGNGQHVGEGHAGKHGVGGGMHGLQPRHLPKAHASAEDTADGARLVFTPDDPKDLDVLRSKLKNRITKLMAHCDGGSGGDR